MTALCKADILTVNVKLCAGGYTFKNKIALAPKLFYFKASFINTAGVVVRDVRRVAGKGIVNVGIVWVFIT